MPLTYVRHTDFYMVKVYYAYSINYHLFTRNSNIISTKGWFPCKHLAEILKGQICFSIQAASLFTGPLD